MAVSVEASPSKMRALKFALQVRSSYDSFFTKLYQFFTVVRTVMFFVVFAHGPISSLVTQVFISFYLSC